MGLSEPEKEIKKLRKKLDQIAKLKERVAAGEKLEINQVIIWARIHKTDQDQPKISSRSENWIKLVLTKTGSSDLKFDHFFLCNMVKSNCWF